MPRNFVLLCAVVALLHELAVATDYGDIDFEKLYDEVKPDPKDPTLSIARILAARQAAPSASPIPDVCLEKSKKSVFVFGKCPNKCRSNLRQAFAECGPRIQFGCDLTPCSGGFRCQINATRITENTVCPGDKVVFNKINIKRMEMLSYGIDLTANPLETDFYILFDATGSMGSSIAAAKTNADKILRVFGTRPKVAFGVGFYRDDAEAGLPLGGFQNVRKITPITDNKGNPIPSGETKIRNALNSLTATGGADRDEANLVALYKLATDPAIGWRKRSRKIIVQFGDWPGHEPTCVLPGLRLTRTNVVSALNALKISVIVVNFRNMNANPSQFRCVPTPAAAATGQGSFIARGTMGAFVSSSNRTALCEAIEEGLENLPKVFEVDGSACAPFIDSTHVPPLPITLPPGASTFVENRFTIKPAICGVGRKFTCQYKYTESGADLPKVDIEFVKVRGC